MPQYMDYERFMLVCAVMVGLSGAGTWHMWREGQVEEGEFLKYWFDTFSHWIGACLLFGLALFCANWISQFP